MIVVVESFATWMRPPKEYFEAMRVLSVDKGPKVSLPGIQAVRNGVGMVIIILGIPRMNMYSGW